MEMARDPIRMRSPLVQLTANYSIHHRGGEEKGKRAHRVGLRTLSLARTRGRCCDGLVYCLLSMSCLALLHPICYMSLKAGVFATAAMLPRVLAFWQSLSQADDLLVGGCRQCPLLAQGKRRGSLLGSGTNPGLEYDRAGGDNQLMLSIGSESNMSVVLPLLLL
jgi:hypothetical protein